MIPRLLMAAIVTLVACIGPFGLPNPANAQSAAPPRIGVLLVARTPEDRQFQAFRRALSDAGYSEGRNLVIEWRFSGGDYTRMPELVADLVQRKIEVLVVDTTLATQAAKRATSTIPIVMTSIADPVGSGLVASLAHPGGNVTGLSTMTTELVGQKLQLLKDIVPQLTRVASLGNPDSPYTRKVVKELKVAAASLSIELNVVNAQSSH